jgi:hypothetical protein
MSQKIEPNFFSIVIVIILGGALYKQFDFENFTFEKPALAAVYIFAFIISIVMMIKKSKNKENEKKE